MIPGHNIQQSGCCVFDFSSPHQLALGSTAFAASPLSVWPSHSLGHLLVLAVAAGASVVVETPIVCKLFTEIAIVQRTERRMSGGTRTETFHGLVRESPHSRRQKQTDELVTWIRNSTSGLAWFSRGWSRGKAGGACACVLVTRRRSVRGGRRQNNITVS